MQLAQLAETLEQNDEIAGKLAPMLAAWSAATSSGWRRC